MFMEEEKYLYHDFVTMDDEGVTTFQKKKDTADGRGGV